MIKFILNEMLETERTYNQLLYLIRNKYMRPMVAASKLKDPLVKSTDIPVLFNHLPELIRVSDKLLRDLQTSDNIGHTFCSLEAKLVVFLKYAMHYRTNLKTIRKACNNVLFVKIDRENLSKRDTNRLGMSDYLIAPIQRIPRYCLLIKDLQKYTQRSNPSYTELDLALKILTGLAVAMDYAQDNKPLTTTSRPSNKTL
ncbi:Dbl homology domain-containing protein [Mycotypha africana]|uniref:rho guanine nucleotide exchange factor n=1 Tax=Mycotypha africana TaxID=64632 RepID=UPI002301B2E7|nr:rho guanine nucleotide exchange factor [Mycotypha africana]KAI8992043.1 Dbl homology domain-containing protein [Mycotypha africana]